MRSLHISEHFKSFGCAVPCVQVPFTPLAKPTETPCIYTPFYAILRENLKYIYTKMLRHFTPFYAKY